jgi:transcriptional regulator with XRE-family HTH domain
MLDRYLKGAEPGLHTLELIADALQTDPRELIKPDIDPVIRAHTLMDCLEAVNKAATGKPLTITLNTEKLSTDIKVNQFLPEIMGTSPEAEKAMKLYKLLTPETTEALLSSDDETKKMWSEGSKNFVVLNHDEKMGLHLACSDAAEKYLAPPLFQNAKKKA